MLFWTLKKKVDIHKVPRDKKYVSDLTIVGPNHSEEEIGDVYFML